MRTYRLNIRIVALTAALPIIIAACEDDRTATHSDHVGPQAIAVGQGGLCTGGGCLGEECEPGGSCREGLVCAPWGECAAPCDPSSTDDSCGNVISDGPACCMGAPSGGGLCLGGDAASLMCSSSGYSSLSSISYCDCSCSCAGCSFDVTCEGTGCGPTCDAECAYGCADLGCGTSYSGFGFCG